MKIVLTLLMAAILVASLPLYSSAGPLAIADTPDETAPAPGVRQRALNGVIDILRRENFGQKIKQIIDQILKRDKRKPDSKKEDRAIPENHKKQKDRAVYI
ncbi:hypothetical protein MNBD_NITROSPINAE02-565 [hydrothermal vent metagenome]|uniref:Uncharacterized protein n=1 Tax=hydrothermal vent metagenome TaxID=652676 RepID=A0A3B1C1F8_9ZZZZ